jgi:hypothetical protein
MSKKSDNAPLNVITHGNGYIVSNSTYKVNSSKTDTFYVELQFKVSHYLNTAPIIYIATINGDRYMYCFYGPTKTKGRIITYINGFDDSSNTYVNYMDFPKPLDINTWYRIQMKKEKGLWYLICNGWIMTVSDENETTAPSDDDFHIYFAGSPVKELGALDDFFTNIKVNNELVTCSDCTHVGDITSTCVYNTDPIAVNINPAQLTCIDFCNNQYITSYTANTPWDVLQCCPTPAPNFVLHGKDVGPNKAGVSPFLAYQSGNDGNVQCLYDRNLIDDVQQVENAFKFFGDGGKVIQDAFCESKTLTDCPPDMKNGCSRYFAVNKDGDYCRDLFNKKSDVEKDISIFNYCTRNNTNECKCVNRVCDPDYLKLKQGNPFLDSCWYIPCANSTRYLIPSELKRQGECPDNICQIVFDISQAHDVDIDHIKADINCDFSGGGLPNHIVPWYYIAALALSVVLLLIYALK